MQTSPFSLDQQTVKLAHTNIRDEKHGDEPAGAADLKISFTDGTGILSEFHPRLRHALYMADEQRPDLPGTPAEPTVRVFGDLIDKLHLRHALKGADVVIGFGLGGGSDIALQTVDVDGFTAELAEGGSVTLTFRVKCHPSGEQVKRLYEVLGHDITISVTPAVDKQGSLEV